MRRRCRDRATHVSARYRAVIEAPLAHPFGMEVRNITIPEIGKAPAATNTQLMWMKAGSPMGDDMNLHKCTVAFASDWGLGVTALLPHGVCFVKRVVPSGEPYELDTANVVAAADCVSVGGDQDGRLTRPFRMVSQRKIPCRPVAAL